MSWIDSVWQAFPVLSATDMKNGSESVAMMSPNDFSLDLANA
jgi:hypothetical protein